MYAIVDIAGQQHKVEKNQKIFVHRLEAEEGKAVEFDSILLIDNDGKIDVGTPLVSGMKIKAKVVQHLKADKIKVFKKKRRKGYQKENGHRQYLTELLIEDIMSGKVKKATKPTTETVKKADKPVAKKAASKPATKKPAAKKVDKPAAKKETKPVTEKKTATKKTATAKKADVKKPATKKATVAKKTTATKKKESDK